MAEKPKRPRRSRSKQTYVPRENAVHVTLYNPSGAALSPEIKEEAQQVLLDLAMNNGLLIGVATT